MSSLLRVLVYRGEPSAEHDPKPYARNQAQKAEWMRDSRVEVTLRPLKYHLERDAAGRPASDAGGRKIVKGKTEKGVDVPELRRPCPIPVTRLWASAAGRDCANLPGFSAAGRDRAI